MSFEDNGLREIRPTDEGVVLDLMHTAKEIAEMAAEKHLQIRIFAWADGECSIRIGAPGHTRFLDCGSWDGKDAYYLGRAPEPGSEVIKEIAPKDISFSALQEEDKKEDRACLPWSRRRMI